MEKKVIIIYLTIFSIAFFWHVFIGAIGGSNAFFGDINVIDEGQFSAWANHMLNGKVPYRDFYYQYGPFMLYPIYFLMNIFGESIVFVRIWSAFGSAIGIVVASILLRKIGVRGLLFLMTLVLLITIPGIHVRQWIVILPILFLLNSNSRNNIRNSLVSGLFTSISFLISFDSGVFTTILVLTFFIYQLFFGKKLRGIFEKFGYFLAGVLLPTLAFVVFAFQSGFLKEYIQVSLDVVTLFSGVNLPNGQGLPNPFEYKQESFSVYYFLKLLFSKQALFYWSYLFLIIFLITQFTRAALGKFKSADVILLFILLFGLLIYVSIVGRSGHYFSIVPMIIVSFSYFLSLLLRINKDRKKSVLLVLIFGTFFLYVFRHVAIFRHSIFPSPEKYSESNIGRITPLRITNAQAYEFDNLNQYIITNSSEKDKIYVFNNIPFLYFLLDRENPTRFDLPLLAGSIEKRYEIVNDLKRNVPKFVIFDKKAWAVDGITDNKRMPEVYKYIKMHYLLRAEVGSYQIYGYGNL